MSRLDWFTIAVVGICIAAIIYLLYKTSNIITGTETKLDPKEQIIDELGLTEDDDATIDPENLETESSDSETTDVNGTATASTDNETATSEANTDNIDDSSSKEVNDADSNANDDNATSSPSNSKSGEYYVIAGSFSLMHNAENFAAQLQRKGYPNAQVSKFNRGKFASVIVDRFTTSASASALVKELKAKGIDSYLQRKRGAN